MIRTVSARKQFLLRMGPELWKEMQAWAADELRCVNGQIEYVLREAVRKRRGDRARGGKERGDTARGDAEPERERSGDSSC